MFRGHRTMHVWPACMCAEWLGAHLQGVLANSEVSNACYATHPLVDTCDVSVWVTGRMLCRWVVGLPPHPHLAVYGALLGLPCCGCAAGVHDGITLIAAC